MSRSRHRLMRPRLATTFGNCRSQLRGFLQSSSGSTSTGIAHANRPVRRRCGQADSWGE
ncbi:hypothetical protein HMPREF9056_00210 [Actinomyces sp. oral taxon 170 str. F0386]|nr:hypothetical protein HMPREF9056_00210 [Actinomyces sp. oral taxon 170 str. F0386]